jgi:RNA polymerase sigma-70 factor (ECF subfamily)
VEHWGSDEAELVRRCKEGSEAAYAVLVQLHRPRLYALAYQVLLDREAAEDVVQETFIAAFRQMERFEPRPSLAAWLNRIALRTAGRAASRQRARPGTSLDAPTVRNNDGLAPAGSTGWPGDHLALANTDPTADPLAAAESADLRRELSAAIAGLPFQYRAAVVVRHVLGLDYAEAARALEIPLNTFKSNLLRGTRMLRDRLAAQRERAGPGVPASERVASERLAGERFAGAAGPGVSASERLAGGAGPRASAGERLAGERVSGGAGPGARRTGSGRPAGEASAAENNA